MIRRLPCPKKEDLRVIGFVACLRFHPYMLITGHKILQCNMFLSDLSTSQGVYFSFLHLHHFYKFYLFIFRLSDNSSVLKMCQRRRLMLQEMVLPLICYFVYSLANLFLLTSLYCFCYRRRFSHFRSTS